MTRVEGTLIIKIIDNCFSQNFSFSIFSKSTIIMKFCLNSLLLLKALAGVSQKMKLGLVS